MRLAITHPYCWPEVRRGAERIIVETARAMAGRGHEVTVLTSGWAAGRTRDDGFTTVRYRRRFHHPARHERWFGWRILPALTRGRFDAVHSMMPNDALAAIRAKRLGAEHRTVYEELGIPYPEPWDNLPDGHIRRRLVRDVDEYGCMSRFALDVLAERWGRKGVLIPGGVRTDQFTAAPEREPQPTVLFSGTLDDERKGVALLLEAAALVLEHVPDLQLWLSGQGDAHRYIDAAPIEVRAHVEALDLGAPQEQAARYGRAWATALPSINDSFGMVLVESLACGTPIVVADHSAPPEMVRPGAGTICEPGDATSLAEALRKALALAADPATVDRCRAVAAEYDWDRSLAPAFERIYAGSG